MTLVSLQLSKLVVKFCFLLSVWLDTCPLKSHPRTPPSQLELELWGGGPFSHNPSLYPSSKVEAPRGNVSWVLSSKAMSPVINRD